MSSPDIRTHVPVRHCIKKNCGLIINPGPKAKFPYIGPGLTSSLRQKKLIKIKE